MNIWVWATKVGTLHSALIIHSAQSATPTEAKVLMRSGKNALNTCTRTSTTVASALSTSASAPSHSSHCHIIMFPRHVSFLSVPIQYVHILYFRISFVSEHPSACNPLIQGHLLHTTIHNHTPLNDCFCLLRTDDCFCYVYSWQWMLMFFLLLPSASVTPCQCKCQYQQSHCARYLHAILTNQGVLDEC